MHLYYKTLSIVQKCPRVRYRVNVNDTDISEGNEFDSLNTTEINYESTTADGTN